MVTNKALMMQPTTFCDRCHTILAVNFDYKNKTPKWERIEVPKKGAEGHTKYYDFCDEKCRIVYFRGKSYFQRKLAHRERNWVALGYLIER